MVQEGGENNEDVNKEFKPLTEEQACARAKDVENVVRDTELYDPVGVARDYEEALKTVQHLYKKLEEAKRYAPLELTPTDGLLKELDLKNERLADDLESARHSEVFLAAKLERVGHPVTKEELLEMVQYVPERRVPMTKGEKLLWNAMFVRRYADTVYDPHFDFIVEHSGVSEKEALQQAFIHAIEAAHNTVRDFRKGRKDIAAKLGFKSEAHLMMRQALE